MIVGVIIACEIGFWVVLAAGLAARYGLRWPRVGAALLVCVPLLDLVLLAATVVDLRRGAAATAAHGLAAAYIGFSIAFGHQIITTLDRRVAFRFAGGPVPPKPPRHGPGRTRYEWAQWHRGVLAWALACGLLLAAIALVGDPSRTSELQAWVRWLSVGVTVWLITGPGLALTREARHS